MKSIITFAIDEQSVNESEHSWRDMFFKQLWFGNAMLLGLSVLLYGLVSNGVVLAPIQLVGIAVLAAGSYWPAAGAWYYWSESHD